MRHQHSQLDTKEFQMVTVPALVTHVADGDTFTCTVRFKWFAPKETLKIRLNGINTPEISKDEPYAQEAAEYTTSRLLGKKVSVVLARRKGSQSFVVGNFGRVIGFVYPTWFSKSLNEELLDRGLARLYDKPCGWMTKSWWRKCERCWKRAIRHHRGMHTRVNQQSSMAPFLWGVGAALMVIFFFFWFFV